MNASHQRRAGKLVKLALLPLVMALILPVAAQMPSDTVIKSLRTVRAAANPRATEVVVEVHSKRPFRVGALGYTLKLGDREYRHYLFPKDGSLNTLLFYVPSGDFARIRSGEKASVYYSTPDRDRRDLGTLDKGLLGR